MSYDAKCYDLAAAFLDDAEGGWVREQHKVELAQLIQNTIEDYFETVGAE